MTALGSLAADVVRTAFRPRIKLTGSQWANQYGWIARSAGAAEPGKYSTDGAEYLVEMLDVMCDETHRDIVINKPSQVGYTEALMQVCAYTMRDDPSGIIVIRPTDEDAKSWMKERIDPMVAESPHLKGIIRSEGGRRTSDDTLHRKVFLGGWLVAVGANSATGLRGRPSRRLIGDERSGWKPDAAQQGDPWDLGIKRTSRYWNAKRIQGSTPGEEDVCPITKALAKSDWREYHVSCPSCGWREPFRWKAPDGTFRVVCEKDPADQLIPQTARYLCTACGVLIPESEKPKMLRGGSWVPRFPGRSVVGFDLGPAVISPWMTWADLMTEWVEAKDNHEQLKVFVTHNLAETWRNPAGERIDVGTLQKRQADEMIDSLPPWVGACFAFVDVQKDRLVLLVLGVGAGEECIIWRWDEADGDPTKPETWAEAREILLQSHGDVPIWGTGIDTGFLTDHAWKAVDLWGSLGGLGRVIGTKGEDGRGRPWIQKPGMVTRRRVRRPWILGTETAKDALQLRLMNPVPPGGPGAVHFAESLDPAFFDQLTSEERQIILVKGRQQRAWRPISKDRANDGLDGTIGALGVMYSFGPRFLPQLGALAAKRAAQKQQQLAPPAPEPTPDEQRAAEVQHKRATTRRGFVGGWKR